MSRRASAARQADPKTTPYRLDLRNTLHASTREWHSRNPFRQGAPWLYATVEDALMRAGVATCTDARVVDERTGVVVVQWRKSNAALVPVLTPQQAQAQEDARRNDGRVYGDPVCAARMGGTVPPGYDPCTGEELP